MTATPSSKQAVIDGLLSMADRQFSHEPWFSAEDADLVREAARLIQGGAVETTAPLELIPVVNDSGQFFGMASPTSRDGQDSMWKGPVYVQARQVKATAPLCTCGGDDYGAHMETCPVGRTP